MSNRLIKTTDSAKIYYDSETGEYVVKPLASLKRESTWYFTDDIDDALGTAKSFLDNRKRKSNPARVTKKAVDRAGTDWQKQIELYGEHNMSAQRAFQKYMDLKQEWEAQTGKKYGAARNPVPLAKGTIMQRKKKFSPAQIAAQKRFAEMARSGVLKRARKKTARKAPTVSRVRKSNPREKFGSSEIIAQVTNLATRLKITVQLEKHGGASPKYQIVHEGGSPMSQMLSASEMRTWLHGAFAATLACKK